MKLMIASDLHGSAVAAEALLQAFQREQAEQLLLLGDLLYHGPRNDLPEGYCPKKVISLLNPYAERILCVRGNCDTEVDQMVLQFPILADYIWLSLDGLRIFATHGHLFGEDNPPPLAAGDLLLCGHTHVSGYRAHGNFSYLNPGSVSIPKNGTPSGYLIAEDRTFTWKHLTNGAPYLQTTF